MIIFLEIVVFILAVLVIASVILQSSKSSGLSGSIAGGAEVLFGGKRKGIDDILAKATKVVGVLFAIAVILLERSMTH